MLLVPALVLLAATVAYNVFTGRKRMAHMPGWMPLVSPMSLPGVLLPTVWWNPGRHWMWRWRDTAYLNRTHDVISVVPLLIGSPFMYVGSVDVARQLVANEAKTGLFKPPAMTIPLRLWGDNVLSSNGSTWKRHRRIVAPSFSPYVYNTVWDASKSIYAEMTQALGWDGRESVVVPDIAAITTKFAFIIISRCGFGLEMSWGDPDSDIGQDLSVVCETGITRLVAPPWAYKLPSKKLRTVDRSWKSLEVFLQTILEQRIKESKTSTGDAGGADIFTSLIASLDSGDKLGLTKQEVIGNIFIMLFAGHETTANTIAATISCLAIYQDEQEKALEEINRVAGDRELTLNDMESLTHLIACFHEALRIYPTALFMPRDTAQDVVIEIKHPKPETIVIPKDTRIVMDLIGMHHDPNTYPNPDHFQPSRWYGVPILDVTNFGAGPRGCLGRRFAHVESICFLANVLREWKLDVDLQGGETRGEYEKRVLEKAVVGGLSLGVGKVSVRLTRRAGV